MGIIKFPEALSRQKECMDKLQGWWSWIVAHRIDLVMAAVFGAFFWIIGDVFAVDSRIRAGIRHIGNKLSEQSISRLKTRIKQLEAQRERYATYMASDKALYMATLQGLVLVGVCIATGGCFAGLADIWPTRLGGLFKLWSIAFYFGAILFGSTAIRFSLLDSRAKVAKVVDKIDLEILELNIKLAERTK
jgi:hypothetical protein